VLPGRRRFAVVRPDAACPAPSPEALTRIRVALHATFDADNHDTLAPDVTRLMIELAHLPDAPPPRDATLRRDRSPAWSRVLAAARRLRLILSGRPIWRRTFARRLRRSG